jgi:hypothetical protein
VTKLHELKTWPVAFEAVERGSKHHEIRKNDRYFIKGDLLQLREWDPTTEKYTGRERTVRVSHISYGGSWDLPDDLCVMSIERRETDRPSTVAALQAVAEAAAPFAHQPFDGDSMRLTDALAALGETQSSPSSGDDHRDFIRSVAKRCAGCNRWEGSFAGTRFVGCEAYRSEDPGEWCVGCEAQAIIEGLAADGSSASEKEK